MKTIPILFYILPPMLLSSLDFIKPAFSDELNVGVYEQGDKSIQTPKNGLSMNKVRDMFGDPLRSEPPVGEPPITRWYYSSFTVYFEHDKVIHSVLTHQK